MTYRVVNHAHGKTIGECFEHCWAIHVSCSTGHHRRIGANDVLRLGPADATVDAVAERLVCSECGSRDGSVAIWNDQGAAQRRNIDALEANERPIGMVSPGGGATL